MSNMLCYDISMRRKKWNTVSRISIACIRSQLEARKYETKLQHVIDTRLLDCYFAHSVACIYIL